MAWQISQVQTVTPILPESLQLQSSLRMPSHDNCKSNCKMSHAYSIAIPGSKGY